MKEKRAVLWLRLSFLLGAVTDAVAVIPMVSTQSAGILWGFQEFSAQYRFAMQMGAALMAAWTLLLIWASFKPLERRIIAPMTQLIVICFVVAEAVAIHNGVLSFGRALTSFVIQALILVLYSFALLASRPSVLRAGKIKA
jgi:hypothetical protein